MSAKVFMTRDEFLRRRFNYRGQLRRHRNAKRNAAIREFWQAKVAAELGTGKKPRGAHALANEAASKKFNISRSQIRRALNDTDYLMDEASLKLRIRELSELATHNKRFLSQCQRVKSFEAHFAVAIQAKKKPRYARTYAVKRTAVEFGVTSGQIRRILDSFEIPRYRAK
jgi:hypothetical protein